MAIAHAQPIRFTPRGLCDSFDATDRFPGACQALSNLVFDQSNPELVVPRPGVALLVDFASHGFTNPGFISVHGGIGSRVYGMIATSRYAGHDEPFCYDTATSAFVAIGTVTSPNTPISPPTSGDWTPPTMANIGTMIVVTHPGFSGAAGVFYGIIDISNPAAPVWRCENTLTNGLPSVPTAVANFNNRAWFACGNKVLYTDELTNPLTRTNASQAVTAGDASPVTALSGLPLQTTSSGIIGALSVFKLTQVWQITGDTVTQNLALNYVSLNIGTQSPRSIVQSPYGIYFSSSGGPYTLDQLGMLRPITHSFQELQPDISDPFQSATTPSRWAAGYTSTVYRVCGDTVVRGQGVTADYWFDEHKRRWSGPHTFAYDCASSVGDDWILSSVNHPGQLMESSPNFDEDDTYEDLGTPTTCVMRSSTFPKVGDMLLKQMAESQIELAASYGRVTYYIEAQNSQGQTLQDVSISLSGGTNLWGTNIWGTGIWSPSQLWGGGGLWGTTAQGGSNMIWGAPKQIPDTYPVPWTSPLVFEKMQLQIQATASPGVSIGTFYGRYTKTGYMTMGPTLIKP